jgi:putative exporter of polyketide antibiotics
MSASTARLVQAEAVQRRRMLLALAAGTLVFTLAIAGTYEALGGASGLANTFGVETPSFFSAFAGARDVNIFAPQNYLGFGFVHPLFLVLTLTVAISIGTASVAGDIESGRAEMLYTRPLRRTAVLFARLRLWAVAQALVVAAGAIGALVGMRVAPDLRSIGAFAVGRVVVQYAPLLCFVGALSFLASAASHTRGQALGIAVGVVALGYLVNFLSLLWHPLAFAHWLTPFGYYTPSLAIDHIDWGDVLVLSAAAALLFAIACRLLVRRDLI